ncbi:MAG: OsmC family protein [Anaerolineales bacterium]
MATRVKEGLNGVDVNQLVETIDHIKEQPELAKFQFRAHTNWISGAHSRTQIKGFYGAGQEDSSREQSFVLDRDEPPVLLGQNKGPNAVESVLHALASCLAVGFVYNAAAQDIEVRDLSFEVEGNLDLHGFLGLSDQVRPGYQDITVRYHVDADAPREKLLELCEYAQQTSPVMDVLTNPVDINVEMAN